MAHHNRPRTLTRPMMWLRLLIAAGHLAPIPGLYMPTAHMLHEYGMALAGPTNRRWLLRGSYEHLHNAKLMARTILWYYAELRNEDEPLTLQDLIPYVLNNF